MFEHDLFGKPVSTFPDHALEHPRRDIVPPRRHVTYAKEICQGDLWRACEAEALDDIANDKRPGRGHPVRVVGGLGEVWKACDGLVLAGEVFRLISPNVSIVSSAV